MCARGFLFLGLLLVAVPCRGAEPPSTFVSNLGIQVLARSTLVLRGTMSETQKQAGLAFARDMVPGEVLYGETQLPQITVIFLQPTIFDAISGEVALALRPFGQSLSSFELVGAPLVLDAGPTLVALKAYLEIETARDTREERCAALKRRIDADIGIAGVRSRFAAVELLFAIKHHPQLFSHADYERLGELEKTATATVKSDLALARLGMVVLFLKSDTQVEVLKAKNDELRAEAIKRLGIYFDDVPEAFNDSDARRCDLIGAKASPRLQRELAALKGRISARLPVKSGDEAPKEGKSEATPEPALSSSTPSPFELPEQR